MSEVNLNALCYVNEQTSFSEDMPNFGYTVHKTEDPSRWFLKFKAVLQSFDRLNRNKRNYDGQNIMENITNGEYTKSMLKQNSWVGEMEHPAASIKGENLSMERLCNPDPKHSSHYIRKPWLDGNLLWAPIQTDSSTAEGMNMAIKMVDGHVIPGFSVRAFGKLIQHHGMPTVWVRKLVTYDTVLYPSHPEALGDIQQDMVLESANATAGLEEMAGATIIMMPALAMMAANNSKETEYICESFGLTIDDVVGVTSTGNSVVISEGANRYVQPITDKFVRNKTRNMVNDFLGGGM